MPITPRPSSPRTAREWIECGHHFAASTRIEDLSRALLCYDRARTVCDPSESNPAPLRDLGLAWMNRGNILQQPGPHYDCVAALNAYDQALVVFFAIPDATPDLINTIATVYLNRGRAHQRLLSIAEASKDYRKARETLRPLVASGDFAAIRNFAGATVNFGQIQLDSAAPDAELTDTFLSTRAALTPFTDSDAVAATLALELSRLELVLRERTLTRDSLGDFTDTLEVALALAASWAPRSHPTALDAATQLFRLGATAYAECQPQFLLEFLREALDPASGTAPFASFPTFHTVAADALDSLRLELNRTRVFDAEIETSHRLAAIIQDLNQPTAWLKPRLISS